jgi:hypothetical protein
LMFLPGRVRSGFPGRNPAELTPFSSLCITLATHRADLSQLELIP